MLQSPMCDAVPFVRQLECVYSSLWSRWLDEHHSDRHVQECSPLEASEGSSLEEAVEVKVGELAVGCTGSAESTQISSGAPVESGQSECTSAAPGDENS